MTGIIRLFKPLAGLLFPAAFIHGAVLVEEPAPAGRYKDYNLPIISVANTGVGHTRLYGYGHKTTPNLEKQAEGAPVFEEV